MELYLAAADLATPAIMETIATRLLAAQVPDDFVWLIEGPGVRYASKEIEERCRPLLELFSRKL